MAVTLCLAALAWLLQGCWGSPCPAALTLQRKQAGGSFSKLGDGLPAPQFLVPLETDQAQRGDHEARS